MSGSYLDLDGIIEEGGEARDVPNWEKQLQRVGGERLLRTRSSSVRLSWFLKQ